MEKYEKLMIMSVPRPVHYQKFCASTVFTGDKKAKSTKNSPCLSNQNVKLNFYVKIKHKSTLGA